MNKLIFALVFFYLISVSGAVNVQGPETIPENAVYGFSVELDSPGDWSKTEIKIKGDTVIELRSSGSVILDDFSGMYDWNPGSNTIYVSVFGFEEGNVEIEAVSDNDSDSLQVAVFTPLNDNEKDEFFNDIQEKVDEKLSSVDDLAQEVNTLEIMNKELETKVNSFQGQIDTAQSGISSLQSDVGSFDSRISGVEDSLNSELSSLRERVSAQEKIEEERKAAELAEQKRKEQEANSNPLTGMFNLINNYSLPLAFVVIIALFAGAVFIFREQLQEVTSSIYSNSEKDEDGLPVSKEDEDAAEEILEGGRWAFKERD